MVNSRRKGADGELALAKYLVEHGHDARRSQQFCGTDGTADIKTGETLASFHIECKRTESINAYKALDQAIRDCPDGKTPTVFHRKNNRDWIVIMRADDFLKLAA